MPQAKILDDLLTKQGVALDAVLNLEIDDDLLVKRVTGRLVHPASGRAYNIYFNPPKVSGVDDVTGEPLVKRGDDTAEKLIVRLKEFHEKTTPVLQVEPHRPFPSQFAHYESLVLRQEGQDD